MKNKTELLRELQFKKQTLTFIGPEIFTSLELEQCWSDSNRKHRSVKYEVSLSVSVVSLKLNFCSNAIDI